MCVRIKIECDDLSLFSYLHSTTHTQDKEEEEEEEEDEECTWELCISYGINLPDKMRAATPLVIETERFTYRPADLQSTD